MSSRQPWSWPIFWIAWLALALVPFVPVFRDGYLYNSGPMLLLYVVVAASPAKYGLFASGWAALHAACALAVAILVGRLRRRLPPARRKAAAAISALLVLCATAWALHACWPDGVYFDAANIEYDVSDLVQAVPGGPARFEDTDAVAACLERRMAGRAEHFAPHHILGFRDEPTVLAWGTWPEHYRFRRELEALRRE